MIKLSSNFLSIGALIVLISFLFRYYLSDMIGVMAIVAIAFILFYFYSHLFESIARKSFSPFTKDIQTHVILFLLLLLLLGSVLGRSKDPRNAFRIMAIFLSLFLVVKLVLVEYYLNREAQAEAKRQEERLKSLKARAKKR
jgi:hypothetical protein